MKLLEWLKGKTAPGDEQPYERPPDADRPATEREIYLLCACLHFSASVLLPILFYTVGGIAGDNAVGGLEEAKQGRDLGLPAEVGFVLFHLIQALQWPMSWVLGFLSKLAGAPLFTGILGYVPIALNSLLWAVPIYYVVRGVRAWRQGQMKKAA